MSEKPTITCEDSSSPEQSVERGSDGLLDSPEVVSVIWSAETPEETEGLRIAEILSGAGASGTYFAGGYVRDLMMHTWEEGGVLATDRQNFKPHDIDLAVDLTPQEIVTTLAVHNISAKVVGQSFQIVLASCGQGVQKHTFEIVPLRQDDETSSGTPSDRVRSDVARRDFTINSLYFDPHTQNVVDHAGGLADLAANTLSFTGSARERIVEDNDPIRILRYVRFRTKYKLDFDQDLRSEIEEFSPILADADPTRLKTELDKILTGPRAGFAINDLARIGALEYILPEVAAMMGVRHIPKGESSSTHTEGDAYQHTLRVVESVNRPPYLAEIRRTFDLPEDMSADDTLSCLYEHCGSGLAWSLLLHDVGKTHTQGDGERLLDDGTVQKFHNFHKHEKVSQELFDKIVQTKRFLFSGKEKEDIGFLIREHMNAHNLVAKKSPLKEKKKTELYNDLRCEALLFHQLADAMANYTTEHTFSEKIATFRTMWAEMNEYRAKEGIRRHKKERIISFMPEILLALENAFVRNAIDESLLNGPLRGFPKNALVYLLLEDQIQREDLAQTAESMIADIVASGALETNDKGAQAQAMKNVLCEKYSVDFDAIPR